MQAGIHLHGRPPHRLDGTDGRAMSRFNASWAAAGTAWAAAPDSSCYRTIAIPPAFLTSMSGTALYVWFLLSNTAFPWPHDTIGTAEDLGIFFGSLSVPC